MPKLTRPYSPTARKAAELLGLMIRAARLERNMTAQELAERAGGSRPLLSRVEKGDMPYPLVPFSKSLPSLAFRYLRKMTNG